MKIAIIGAAGMLGTYFSELYECADKFDFRANKDIYFIDITNPDSIKNVLNSKLDIIINCAAYTDVDGAESEGALTNLEINANGVKNLAEFCLNNRIKLIHFSTDYIFRKDDLNAEKKFVEDDVPNPLNLYGTAKFAGERFLIDKLQGKNDFYLIRAQWLYGNNGRNFVDAILKRATELEIFNESLEIVDDQFGCPTYAKDLAEKVKEMISHNLESGIWHVTNSGSCSWYEFAKEILILNGFYLNVIPITTEDYNHKFRSGKKTAKRPQISILSNDKLNTKLKPMRHWKDAIRDYLSQK